jgi:hypothetical protein
VRTLWSLLVSIALAFGPTPALAAPSAIPQTVIEAAFQVACSYTPNVDCLTAARPRVLYDALFEKYGALGRYPESGLVQIDYHFAPSLANDQMIGVEAFTILVHEMVHHLDDLQGYLGSDLFSLCASEGKAWYVSNAFDVKIGRPDLAQPDWQEAYPYCKGLVDGN